MTALSTISDAIRPFVTVIGWGCVAIGVVMVAAVAWWAFTGPEMSEFDFGKGEGE